MIIKGITRDAVLFSATALLASISSFACTGPACPCESLGQAIAKVAGAEVADANEHVNLFDAQLMGDQEFMREALEDGAAKVMLGQLAQRKSGSADIKQFGQKMALDQTQLSELLMQRVAKLLGVPTPKDLSRKNKQLAASLEALSGAQFDQAYIKAVVKDQKQDLKKSSGEQDTTQNQSVKIAAEQGANLIQQHLELIQRIAEDHAVVAENHDISIGMR